MTRLFVSQDQCDLVYLDSPLQSPRATVTRLFVRQDLCDLVSLDFSPVLLSPGSLGARTSVTWYPYVVPLRNPSRATVDQALCEPGLSICFAVYYIIFNFCSTHSTDVNSKSNSGPSATTFFHCFSRIKM